MNKRVTLFLPTLSLRTLQKTITLIFPCGLLLKMKRQRLLKKVQKMVVTRSGHSCSNSNKNSKPSKASKLSKASKASKPSKVSKPSKSSKTSKTSKTSKASKPSKTSKTSWGTKISRVELYRNCNDKNSAIYQKYNRNQALFIKEKLCASKCGCFSNELKLLGTPRQIEDGISANCANLIKVFFKNIFDNAASCLICGERDRTITRAHSNISGGDRRSILQSAIDEYYENASTPIPVARIYTRFIELHIDKPLFPMCSQCHHEYDNGNY